MSMSDAGRLSAAFPAEPVARRDRRPLRYCVGTVVRTNGRRVELACVDGRVWSIRLAERTLYTLANHRLSGPDALRPGLEVRIASVDSGRGTIAVVVEVLGAGHGPTTRPHASIRPLAGAAAGEALPGLRS
jgi:hypothetical protein